MTPEPQLLQASEINSLWELVRVWHKIQDKAEIYCGKVCQQVPNTKQFLSSEPFLYNETGITIDVREAWDENTRKLYRISAIKNHGSSSAITLGSYSGYPGEEAENYFLRTRKIIDDKERAELERQAQARKFSLENALSEARQLLSGGRR